MSASVPARFVHLRVGPQHVWAWFNLAEIAGVVEGLVTANGLKTWAGLILTNGREFEIELEEDRTTLLDILRRLEAT